MIDLILKKLGSKTSKSGMDWLGNNAGLSSKELWNKCERADWMLWFCAEIGIHPKSIISAALDCAERGLKYIPEREYKLPTVYTDLRKWIKGETIELDELSFMVDGIANELEESVLITENQSTATLEDAFCGVASSLANITFLADEGTIDNSNIVYEAIDDCAGAYAYAEASQIAVVIDLELDMNLTEIVEDTEQAVDIVYDFAKAEELKAMADVIRVSISWEEIEPHLAVLQCTLGRIH